MSRHNKVEIVTHNNAAGQIDACRHCERHVDARSGGAYYGVHHGARDVPAEDHTCLSPPSTDAETREGRTGR